MFIINDYYAWPGLEPTGQSKGTRPACAPSRRRRTVVQERGRGSYPRGELLFERKWRLTDNCGGVRQRGRRLGEWAESQFDSRDISRSVASISIRSSAFLIPFYIVGMYIVSSTRGGVSAGLWMERP